MRYAVLALLWVTTTATFADEASYGVISYRDFHVRQVTIGDSYGGVIEKLGKPRKEIRIKGDPSVDVSDGIKLYFPGLYISLHEGEVGEIVVTSKEYAVKGIRLGATASEVIAQIGNAKPITINNRTSLRYRSRAQNGQLTDAELRFFLEKNKVTEISLWFPTI